MDCKRRSVGEYLDDAAAGTPTPGGGSISAMAGALAATMGEMAGNFTTDREKFSDVEDDIKMCLKRLNLARNRLLNLANADIEAYGSLDAAYKMPHKTDAEAQQRDAEIQRTLREAMRVPLNVMQQCMLVAEMASTLVDIANPNLLTDVAVCAILAEGACLAASFNVRVNLKYIDDPAVAEKVEPELEEYISTVTTSRDRVTSRVNS